MGTRLRVFAAGVLAVATAAGAGTVDVVLRTRGGSPIGGMPFELQPVVDGVLVTGGRWLRAETGVDGRAVVSDVPPGSYRIRLRGALPETLVVPEHDPSALAPVVSLLPGQERAEAVVELSPGAPLEVGVHLEPSNPPYPDHTLVLVHEDTGFVLRLPIASTLRLALVPGRWSARLEVVSGYLLVGLSLGGQRLTGHVASFMVTATGERHFLDFELRAPARLAGYVDYEDERAPVCVVHARLVEAGPWIDAARERGGSSYERIEAAVDQRDRWYEMVLPDGRWEVRPVCEPDVISTPEKAEVTLAPGGDARVDFSVRIAEGGNRVLEVVVSGRDFRRPVVGATVAAFGVEEAPDGAVPLARATSDEFGLAKLFGLEPGAYRIAAAHPGYLDGETEVDEHTTRARIQLARGGAIHVTARSLEEEPRPGVLLRIERSEPAPCRLCLPELVAARERIDLVTGAGGEGWERGLYPGSYVVRGESGPQPEGSFVRVAVGEGSLGAATEVMIESDEVAEVEAVVVPAARITGRLACDDGERPPTAAALRVFAAGVSSEAGRNEPEAAAVLALASYRLSGALGDTFTVGPLEPGSYLLAVRPSGFERWTWAHGADGPEGAERIDVDLSEPADLGILEIECRPRIDLQLCVRSGEPAPDLGRAEVEASWRRPGEDRGGGRLAVERLADRVRLWGAPSGEVEVEVRLHHPHLLPEPIVELSRQVELERGRTWLLEVGVEAIGGSVTVTAPGAATVRLSRVDASAEMTDAASAPATILPLVDGKCRFEGLVPAVYRLEACPGVACDRVMAVVDRVEVGSDQTVSVDLE